MRVQLVGTSMQNQEQYNDGGIAAFARAAALKSVTLVSPAATHFTVMAMLSGPAMQLTHLELIDLGMCDDSGYRGKRSLLSCVKHSSKELFPDCRGIACELAIDSINVSWAYPRHVYPMYLLVNPIIHQVDNI